MGVSDIDEEIALPGKSKSPEVDVNGLLLSATVWIFNVSGRASQVCVRSAARGEAEGEEEDAVCEEDC